MQNHLSQAIQYYYWGHDNTGKKVYGEITATNTMIAKAILHKQGINITYISQRSMRFRMFTKNSITNKDITYFTRQLATTLQAGIPLIKALEIVIQTTKGQNFKNLLIRIKDDIANGQSFANALQKHPHHFKPVYCNLIYAGEQAGALDTFIEGLANYQERLEVLKAKIRKALWYPAAIIFVAVSVLTLLMVFVIPQFKTMFNAFGANLPWFTQLIIETSEWLQQYGYFVIAVGIVMIFALVYSQKYSPRIRQQRDQLLLIIPFIGSLVQKAIITRFSRTLAITFAAGIPLIDALQVTAKTLGNTVYRQAIVRLSIEVTKGTPIYLATRNTSLFPELVIQMLAIGEASGTLEAMLLKIADIYQQQVDNSVDSLSNLIEPVIIAMLGISIGGLVTAMYLPIFKLGNII